MAYTCMDCGLVRTQPARFCVRCKGRNLKATSRPFETHDHPFSANDDGVPPPPANHVIGNPEETPTSELQP